MKEQSTKPALNVTAGGVVSTELYSLTGETVGTDHPTDLKVSSLKDKSFAVKIKTSTKGAELKASVSVNNAAATDAKIVKKDTDSYVVFNVPENIAANQTIKLTLTQTETGKMPTDSDVATITVAN
ncbi:Uncharacterised protein [Mobiluncus mulieris]|uniref:hypothetical protein n=1 Tax=Mobiluncus mulieris TaxID=2052 RepID=UPI000D9166E0|nr:hypothetical protein [Mobiluncus mulieris]SPX76802.1 Uncharacterised protein [Mobiluncus mulieris]